MFVSNDKSIRKNAVYNVIKTGVSIIFPLITFPYAMKTLSNDSYGVYTFSQSIISYITLLAGLGISNYARREGARVRENASDLNEFANEVFTINIISTLLSFVVLVFLTLFWRKLDTYRAVIYILSLSVLFTTLGTDWINIIFEDYGYITKRTIASHIFSLIIMFIIVKKPSDVIPYAFVSVSGTVVANTLNFFYIRKRIGMNLKLVFNKRLVRHLRPVLVLFMTSIVSVIYINSDVTILGVFKPDKDVSVYGAASKIYSIIKQMINSIAAVTIPRISLYVKKEKTDEIKKIISQTLEMVMMLIIPIAAGLAFLSKPIMTVISDEKYKDAVLPLIILSVSLVFSALGNIFVNTILITHRKENQAFVILALSAVTNIVLNFIFIPEYSYIATASTTLISEFIVMVLSIILSRKVLKLSIKRQTVLSVIGGLIVAAICLLFRFITNNLVYILCSFFSSILLYLVFLCIYKNNIVYQDFILKILKRFEKK